ncbi:hypothetical protein EWM64_g5513 [Hericium alpestre]|uniref:Uncharacterized protein n=1 Tax=Hericium alpestre TaxID=135208 RepID=A0A4Y9ZYK1_9AGAM|nr:hypothetical protein EWM64_g5513 [Hericium alpestre]
MADQSQRDACYNDPTLILLTKDEYFAALFASHTNAAASFPTEAPSYAVSDLILSIYSIICKPLDERSALLCYPQARLEWHDPLRGKEYRDTDFGVILAFDCPMESGWLPSQPPQLLYVVEIKPKTVIDDWKSPGSGTALRQGLEAHIPQICEQAYYGLRHHNGQKLHAFVMMGNSFAFFEFQRPEDLDAYAPPRRVDPSEELAKLLKGGPRKRRRVESVLEGPAKMLRPRILIAFEDIVDAQSRMLGRFFLKALDTATAAHVRSRQPSWFQVPPGDHEPSEASLSIADDQITNAAKKVSGELSKEAAAKAKQRFPSDPPESQDKKDKTYKASSWVKKAVSRLTPHDTRSRPSSQCSGDAGTDDAASSPDNEPGPPSSSSSLRDGSLGDSSADNGADLPPASSDPPSPSDWPVLYEGPDFDPLVAAPALAEEEFLVPKRKKRNAQGRDALEARALEQQRKAMAGKDTKGKDRDI